MVQEQFDFKVAFNILHFVGNGQVIIEDGKTKVIYTLKDAKWTNRFDNNEIISILKEAIKENKLVRTKVGVYNEISSGRS